MTSFVSHTTIDCGNAYEFSEWWKQLLGYLDLDEDPNEPGDQECAIRDLRDRPRGRGQYGPAGRGADVVTEKAALPRRWPWCSTSYARRARSRTSAEANDLPLPVIPIMVRTHTVSGVGRNGGRGQYERSLELGRSGRVEPGPAGDAPLLPRRDRGALRHRGGHVGRPDQGRRQPLSWV